MEYNDNFRKFVSSPAWKEFSRTFPKVDYKYKQTNVINDDYKSMHDIYEKIEDENSKEIEKLGGYLERSLAYDAVWVMAFSLNKTLEKY